MLPRSPFPRARKRVHLRGMIKSVAFMPRRPDLSRAAFREYYEMRHVPLALRYFRFARYVRNHLADDQEPGFDCLSEFWHADPSVVAPLMAGPVGDILRADERAFTDQSNIRAALAEPIPLSVSQPDTQPKTILLLQGKDRDALITAAQERSNHTTLDFLTPFDARPIPCDALIALWGTEAFSLPSTWAIRHRLSVLTDETPAAILAETPQPLM